MDRRIVALLESQKFREVVALCDSLETVGFDSPRLTSQKARALAGLERYGEALPLFEKAIVADYENCENHLDFAVFLMKIGKIGRAITEFRVAERFCPGKNREIAVKNLAVANLKLGRLEDAARFADEGLKADPNDYELLGIKATMLADSAPVRAETLFVRSLRIKDDNPEVVYQYGAFLLKRHREAEAIPLLEKAERLEPDYFDVGISLAEALLAVGKADEALKVMEGMNAAGSAGKEDDIGKIKARALFSKGRYREALVEFKKLPGTPYTMDRIAMCLYHLGKGGEALNWEKKAIAARPKWVQALINYSVILASMGKLDEAEGALEKALDIEPENTTAAENIRRIRKAMGQGE